MEPITAPLEVITVSLNVIRHSKEIAVIKLVQRWHVHLAPMQHNNNYMCG